MTVPSEIVAYLDAKYPNEVKNGQHSIGYLHAAAFSYLLNLIEALPPGIITLKGTEHAEYGESVETIRVAVDAWRTGNINHTCDKVSGRNEIHPLVFLRKHLASLPDDVVAPTIADLAFIPDSQFQETLRLDITGANRSYWAADWKGCTVVSGSVVEALLLWAVERHDAKSPGKVADAGSALKDSGCFPKIPPKDRNDWNLHQLTEVCHRLKIINDETAAQCRIAREFRNLIHPGKAAREAQKCSRATALSALAAIEHVVDELSKAV